MKPAIINDGYTLHGDIAESKTNPAILFEYRPSTYSEQAQMAAEEERARMRALAQVAADAGEKLSTLLATPAAMMGLQGTISKEIAELRCQYISCHLVNWNAQEIDHTASPRADGPVLRDAIISGAKVGKLDPSVVTLLLAIIDGVLPAASEDRDKKPEPQKPGAERAEMEKN